MNLQWHPATGRRNVATVEIGRRSQRALAVGLAVLAVILAVFPLSLAAVLARWRRQANAAEVRILNDRRHEALEVALSELRSTDLRLATNRDLLSRIAFLYGMTPLARSLVAPRPEASDPEDRLAATERRLGVLSASLGRIETKERDDPALAAQMPSMSPVPETSFVVSGTFGWSLSRLTDRSEFRPGLDLAAAEGRPVSSTADGIVRWAGPFPLRPDSPYSHLGRIVVVRHGEGMLTLYGDLGTVAVRRFQRVRRGERLGTVGIDPWLRAPRLRYEVWRVAGPSPVPIDPRIAMLGYRSDEISAILRKALSGPPPRLPVELPREFL